MHGNRRNASLDRDDNDQIAIANGPLDAINEPLTGDNFANETNVYKGAKWLVTMAVQR